MSECLLPIQILSNIKIHFEKVDQNQGSTGRGRRGRRRPAGA